ncbi:MAG: bifunctional [glutamine synthetase] adenylyltransferase/[glutamine synthetase]-adenylyl-L-tyrosine phosphorylase [Actinomycetota bacterium]|nr:bifunctional [glutamine synthetase] adenylyltransferase/[glutamine synthetase]-adenylyl-L-tyrosine phosphorylase [Actinomycetota bacterium]
MNAEGDPRISDELRTRSLGAASRTLAEFVTRDERAAALIEEADGLPSRAEYRDVLRAAYDDAGASGLALEKRRQLAVIAALDLSGEIRLEEVGPALADLADACLDAVLRDNDELTVVGMGKLGARELNYYSDIDLMFVTTGDIGPQTAIAEKVLEVLSGYGPQGRTYEIDTNLRPEGRDGPLVRSLEGYVDYYRKWAKPWEFQALLKARPAAGAVQIAAELVRAVEPLVWPADVTPERIAEMRRIKERVESQAAQVRKRGRSETDDVKLGPGGIRDIEFSIQLLQLVHGAADPDVRVPATLDAIPALVNGGYLAEDDGAGLGVAYRWLRTVEHRLQLVQERRIRHLPSNEAARAELARVMGFKDTPAAGAAARFEAAHQNVLSDVRGRFEKLFYRPMIEALAAGPGVRLSPEALQDRLRLLGFRDVDRAARTLDGLVSGTSRRAKLVRLLAPALLRFLAATPAPDQGLFGGLKVVEALEGRLDGLGALRDNPPGLAFLARLLGSGRLMSEVLAQVPEELQTIADTAGEVDPKPRDRLIREARASLGWRDPEARFDGLRRFKRREMLSIVMSDLTGRSDEPRVGAALADLADACLEAALSEIDAPELAIIGMGKLGGRELSYSSDIDVLFVHDGDQAAAESAAEQLLQAIGSVTPEGQAFRIDAGLRPEGKSGPLARSLESYREYYERWSEPWEHQALTKARVVAGDADIGSRFTELIRPLAFPSELHPDALGQIRHLKARMERERIPRGIEPRRHLKLGPGGMSDIEFAVQILQLKHAHRVPSLVAPNTAEVLAAARDAGLLNEGDTNVLVDSYRFLARLRNRYFLLLGRPVDALSNKPEELEALGISMGFEDQPRQELEETFLRTSRRVRRLCEPLIFD